MPLEIQAYGYYEKQPKFDKANNMVATIIMALLFFVLAYILLHYLS